MTLPTATLQGNPFSIAYTEAFSDKLEKMQNNTLKAVIQSLEQGEEEIVNTAIGESFFLVGDEYSIEGIRGESDINLIRLIPSSHVL